jgi:ArsR family transcriptional regulator
MTIARRQGEALRLPIEGRALERAARVIKILGHPLRLRLIEALEGGERHVAELQEIMDVGQAMVSQQLGILRSHGVVDARRDGLRVYYRIVEPRVIKILDCIRDCDLPELAEVGTLVPLGDLARLSAAANGGPIVPESGGGRRPSGQRAS